MQTEKFFQTMKDGTEIAVNRWIPDNEEDIKAVIVLSHGMLEHALRYDRIGSDFADKGFVFSGHDHRGHGRTAFNAEQKGTGEFALLSKSDGFNLVVSDLEEIIGKVKADFPGKKVILLGHSFGSFVAQAFIERAGKKIDGCVLSGTSGPRRSAVRSGLFVTSLMMLFHKKSYKSIALQKMAFKGYNDRFGEIKTGLEWLSKSESNIEMYMNDSWCGGVATLGFFRDIFKGLNDIHKKNNMKKIPSSLPILFVTGEEDPVGDYGKTIRALASDYKNNGVKVVDTKFYEGYRHEILNEEISERVMDDIVSWIGSNVI